jgi:uncharacterized protein (DUF1499 family)
MCDTILLWRNFLIVVFLTLPVAVSSAGTEPMSQRLAPCPDSPNCVSSDAADPAHYTAPFAIILPAREAWPLVRETVNEIPRTEITRQTDSSLHAECRSAVFRFVADLDLELRPGDGIIAVRSASRMGHSDFGVNRRRVERLREALRSRGVVK